MTGLVQKSIATKQAAKSEAASVLSGRPALVSLLEGMFWRGELSSRDCDLYSSDGRKTAAQFFADKFIAALNSASEAS